MESMWTVQVSVIDFNHRFSRVEERRIEFCTLIRLSINRNWKLDIDVPLSSAD